MKIYLIYDKLAKVHGPVFQQSNDASCARTLSRSPEMLLNKDDLIIYSIGYFDKYDDEECFIPQETGKMSISEFLTKNGISKFGSKDADVFD